MMRINRKNRIIGQLLILLLAVGLAGWWVYEIRKDIRPVSHATLPEAVVIVVEVPPTELKDRLRSTLQVVDRLPENGVRLVEVDMGLMLTPEEVSPDGQTGTAQGPQYAPPSLSLLFFNHLRFAVLDGRPYQEGGMLDDGRILRSIDYEGVVLEWPAPPLTQGTADASAELSGRLERVLWVSPMRVELKRPASKSAASSQRQQAASPAPADPALLEQVIN